MSIEQWSDDLRACGDGFEVIYADPPWNFKSNSAKNAGKNARRHYPCMSLDDICALPVKEIAAPSALLLLWVTVPFAYQAFRVVDAWGFKYVSQVTWDKESIGTGFWARNQHEMLYICKRGPFPCPCDPRLFDSSVHREKKREHSRKPDYYRERIDLVLGGAKRLEMFARETRAGWSVFGNETDRFDAPAQKESPLAVLGL